MAAGIGMTKWAVGGACAFMAAGGLGLFGGLGPFGGLRLLWAGANAVRRPLRFYAGPVRLTLSRGAGIKIMGNFW